MPCFRQGWTGLVLLAAIAGVWGCKDSSSTKPGSDGKPVRSSVAAREGKEETPPPADKTAAAEKTAVEKPAIQESPEKQTPVDDKQPKQPENSAAEKSAVEKPKAKAKPKVEEKPAPPTVPQVMLTEALLSTCLVKVGDTLPDAELPDLEGKKVALRSLFGPKLTVVFFWLAEEPHSQAQAQDYSDDVAKDLADKGVKVVAIDHGDSADVAAKQAKELELAFPVVLDSDKAYFGKLATDKVMRTYLVDATGKILWFDVEYSRNTRRDLLQAIDVLLKGM